MCLKSDKNLLFKFFFLFQIKASNSLKRRIAVSITMPHFGKNRGEKYELNPSDRNRETYGTCRKSDDDEDFILTQDQLVSNNFILHSAMCESKNKNKKVLSIPKTLISKTNCLCILCTHSAMLFKSCSDKHPEIGIQS